MTDDDDPLDAAIQPAFAALFARREQRLPASLPALRAEFPAAAAELEAFFAAEDALAALPPPAEPRDEAPAALGDYEILGELGRGGMGVLYRAREKGLDREVALKRLKHGPRATPEEVRRFRNEARAAARLRHPHLMPILALVELPDELVLAMPLAEGADLKRRLEDGPLPPREAARLLHAVALAMAHAHGQGVVHRDLKPSNILLDARGEPLVADFGLAKVFDADGSLTGVGEIVGTPAYMAPEQAAGDRAAVGPLADIHALGATLFALLVGQPPFQADNAVATLLLVRTQEAPPPSLLNRALPRALDAIVLKCLRKRPEERYASAAALAEDLRRFLDGSPVAALEARWLERWTLALARTRHDEQLHGWSGGLSIFAGLIGGAHAALEALAATDRAGPAVRWAVRGALLAAWLGLLWRWRRTLAATNAFERGVWAMWSGYFAAMLVAETALGLCGRPRGEFLGAEALLAGMGFVALGGSVWGGCYMLGAGFLGLAPALWFGLPWPDLAFGAAWAVALLLLARNLHRRR